MRWLVACALVVLCRAAEGTLDAVLSDLGLPAIAGQLEVAFGSQLVTPGERLSVDQTASQPTVTWDQSDDVAYTLVMHDPDAPSPMHPNPAGWQHWFVTNIPGEDISSGDILTSYQGPSPPPGSGPHRYVLLVFAQPGPIDAEPPPSRSSSIPPQQLAFQYDLDLVAANYFTVEK